MGYEAAFREAVAHICSSIKNLDAEDERVEYSLPCRYRFLDTGAHISYKEAGDGDETETDISVNDGEITVARRGGVTSKIVFREGFAHSSLYSLGTYSFDMSVTTRGVRVALGENGGRLDILYKMTVGGAEKDVRFSVRIEGAAAE